MYRVAKGPVPLTPNPLLTLVCVNPFGTAQASSPFVGLRKAYCLVNRPTSQTFRISRTKLPIKVLHVGSETASAKHFLIPGVDCTCGYVTGPKSVDKRVWDALDLQKDAQVQIE